MGSDQGDGSEDEDVVYVEDDEMAQLEAMAEEEEAQALAEMEEGNGGEINDFETFQESEFGEGEEYEDGQVLQLTAERNDSVAQFDEHHDSIYCVDTLPVAPFNLIATGDGADKAFVWRLSKRTPEEIEAASAQAQAAAEEEGKQEEEVKQNDATGTEEAPRVNA